MPKYLLLLLVGNMSVFGQSPLQLMVVSLFSRSELDQRKRRYGKNAVPAVNQA